MTSRVHFNFVLEDESPGFYNPTVSFSLIVNLCFDVKAVIVVGCGQCVELRFYIPFMKRIFGFSSVETIGEIKNTIFKEQGKVDIIQRNDSTDWLCISTPEGKSNYLIMKTAVQALATLFRKRHPGSSPLVVNHTRSLYNFIPTQNHPKEPESDIEATRMLRLAGLRRVLKFPWRLHLDEEARLYQPFELSQNKRIWVSHLKFFGYYNEEEKDSDIEEDEEKESQECAPDAVTSSS